jgi:hypothetical protein
MTTASSVVPLFYIYRKTVDHKTQTVLTEVHKKEKINPLQKSSRKKLSRILFPQNVNSVVAHNGRHYSITLT